MSRGWLLSHPLLRRALSIAASVVMVGALSAQLVLVWQWQRERECRAAGRRWNTSTCVDFVRACNVENRSIPVGAVFGDGCNTCECLPVGTRCTSMWCEPPDRTPCTAQSSLCIFDPGCDNPRAYRGRGNVFTERAYCGCDGRTFTTSGPAKPYRHPGPCP